MLAKAVVIVLTAVSVRFHRFCRNSCLTGHDNIADIKSARPIAPSCIDVFRRRKIGSSIAMLRNRCVQSRCYLQVVLQDIRIRADRDWLGTLSNAIILRERSDYRKLQTGRNRMSACLVPEHRFWRQHQSDGCRSGRSHRSKPRCHR